MTGKGSVTLVAGIALAMSATPAQAARLLDTTVTVDRAAEQNCLQRSATGAERTVTNPGFGWVSARLDARSGDWDVGVFDAATGERLSGGTSFGAHELAQTLVAADRRLTIQACRRSGAADSARLTVESTAVEAAELVKPKLVAVSTPNRDRKNELQSLGLDVTEHGGPGFLAVVLYGEADARRLRDGKFVYKTIVGDLALQEARDRAADARYARAVQRSTLPSGRDTYRKLEDYTAEMKKLAADNPGLVKPITLPFETYEGRKVEGIEITENVDARDGKPVFLNMGVHHAREWPSGEHTIEWAYELVNGYRAGNERVRRLVRGTRTIIVPVINPDGFNTSREAGETAGGGAGREGPDETVNLVIPYEYHRKNCRVTDPMGPDPERGDCTQQPATGILQFGVDPNRNYGGFWGGPGASEPGGLPPGDWAQDYRGPAPFSEPETRNVQRLMSAHQVTTMITNHTFSNLILRPPGVQTLGPPPDEDKGYKALGDAMAAENGYTSQYGYQLYDTTGTTEDWSYFATGGFGFTFEIGCTAKNEDTGVCDAGHFHPSYDDVVAEYEGTTDEADEDGRDGRGNREAYFIAQESTADAGRHSVIAGSVPAAAVLRLRKTFKTSTSKVIENGVEGEPILFDDTLETVFDPPGGAFDWHTNPSTRPIAAKDTGRAPQGQPSAPLEFTGGITGTGEPGDDGLALPSAEPEADDPMFYNDHTIQIPPQGGGVDNAKMTVKIEWITPVTDWDVRLFRDADLNGVPDDPSDPVSVSQQGTTTSEQVMVAEPPSGAGLGPGNYILRVNNYSAGPEGDYQGTVTFQGPDPLVQSKVESWSLTCEFPEGTVLQRAEVTVERGERRPVDLSACAAAIRSDCLAGGARARGRRLGRAKLGRTRARQRAALKGKRRRSRGRVDSYCIASGGQLRIAYRRKRAALIVASSSRYRVGRVAPGSRVRTLRKRLRGERRVRVGKRTWFLAPAKRARLLFKTRAGVVREVGIADRRLARTRATSRRLLRAWKL